MPKAFDDPTYGLGKVAFIGFLALLSARSTMKLRCQRSLYTIDFLDGMPISAGKWNEEPGELAFQFAVTLDRRFFPADSFDEKAIERMITIRSEYRIREALARSQAGRRMSDGGC